MTNDLEKLREEIAEIVHDVVCGGGIQFAYSEAAADRILALRIDGHTIADLLRMKAIQVVPTSPE